MSLPYKERKSKRVDRNEFIDDEAELSDEEQIVVSDDESDASDDDIDLDIVDKDAGDLDSDQEEQIRDLYHKQLDNEDKRALLLLQEQLEDKDVNIGQRRRRKFRWQTRELIDNNLKRHYDPDDDDSEEDDDEDIEVIKYDETKSRLRRPTGDALLLGSTKVSTISKLRRTTPDEGSSDFDELDPNPGPSSTFFEDSNSVTSHPAIAGGFVAAANTSMNRFLYRDKEVVEALSTRETIIMTREEKDRLVKREIKKVLQDKSIFDQLYS